jgi:hypothetical protein
VTAVWLTMVPRRRKQQYITLHQHQCSLVTLFFSPISKIRLFTIAQCYWVVIHTNEIARNQPRHGRV